MTSEHPPAPQPDLAGDQPDPKAASAPDLKEQFREALARKRGQQADAHNRGSGQDSKVHEAHGKAGGKRQFRRKSG